MFKNYFLLNRIVVEANLLLNDFVITSIFSQEKDKLLFILTNNTKEIILEISVNPGFPYFSVKDKFNRAKKNTIDFFEEYLPSKIISIEIAENDRIIKISTEHCNFFFLIRGKYTNIIVVDSKNNIHQFKNNSEEFSDKSFLNEIKSTIFISYFNIPEIIIEFEDDILNEIKRKYPIISKEILFELDNRITNNEKLNVLLSLRNIIKEIEVEKPIVYVDVQSNEVHLSFGTFKSSPVGVHKSFDNLIPALNYFINKKYYYKDLELKRKKIQKHLENSLQRISRKINNINISIERGSKEEEYQKIGNLLLININSLKTGMKVIEVEDIYDENNFVSIKLDSEISPRKNIDRYFDKAKSDKLKIEKYKELYIDLTKQFNKLKNIENKFLSESSIENYESIMNELKINKEEIFNKKDDIQNKFKHYLIEDKYHVFVGKDSNNNDLLTMQFAKQNDYWFHARSVPGSHVVLRVENNKEIVPKNILKKTASLAAYHSKAKTSGLVPVSFTQKKYVVKKKGMEPGKVALLKEDVLIVKPEIPSRTVYLTLE